MYVKCWMRDVGFGRLEKWFGFDYNDGDDNVDKIYRLMSSEWKQSINVINGDQLRWSWQKMMLKVKRALTKFVSFF